MSLKIVLLLAGIAGLVGIAVGYFLRMIISLGKRGSMELEIKGMMLQAKEEAKKIILEAENKAVETLKHLKSAEPWFTSSMQAAVSSTSPKQPRPLSQLSKASPTVRTKSRFETGFCVFLACRPRQIQGYSYFFCSNSGLI